MRFPAKILIYLLFHFLVLKLSAQKLNPDGTVDCTNPTEVVIIVDTIMMVSSGDYEKFEPSPTPMVFYREIDKYTFWYKLIIRRNCELTFEILPTSPLDNYDFFLYKNTETNFCLGLINRTIFPIRANLYRNQPNEPFTGLSPDSPLKEDTLNFKKYNYLYSNSYHAPLQVKAGEEYYLNVFHTSGEDCGHFFTLASGLQSLTVQAIHKNCFFPMADEVQLEAAGKDSNAGKEILPMEISAQKPILMPEAARASVKPAPDDLISVSGFICEAMKKVPVIAEIKIVDMVTGKSVPATYSTATGKYDALVSKKHDYEIIVNAVGYKEKRKPLLPQKDSLAANLIMEPYKAGEKFVMDKIYFNPNTFALRQEAYSELMKLYDYLNKNENAVIEIQGHTNGNHFIKKEKAYAHLGKEWNFQGTAKKLSQLRADVVKKYLVGKGIAEDRLKTDGYGGDVPVIEKPKTYREALKNIRVEIKVIGD